MTDSSQNPEIKVNERRIRAIDAGGRHREKEK